MQQSSNNIRTAGGKGVKGSQSGNDGPGKGLAIVHSNRPEILRDLASAHLRRYPLAPLENEQILIQSNGIGRWLQLALARDPAEGGLGISASADFLLPAQFFWDAYRIVLGEQALPDHAPFDAVRLRWVVYSLLPRLSRQPGFEPLADFLDRDRNPRRPFQLAIAIADLFEQYQFYRADWLLDWEQGQDRLITAKGETRPVPERQRWQPAFWREVSHAISEDSRRSSRAHLHDAFVSRLRAAEQAGESIAGLPRRVVVFGISSLSTQLIEGLEALATQSEVLICVHNPCRHFWADIVQDRDLLRSQPGKRFKLRRGWPDNLTNENFHQHANPLLAAWGRQGRDFIALLDEKDQPDTYRHWFERIDVFEEHIAGTSDCLLHQLQQGILDLVPAPEDPAERESVSVDDRSITFHMAHSRQREVEILHDQLLEAMREDPQLQPRDVIVMVPDIDAYAPHIEAVFGTLEDRKDDGQRDPRFIPYSIGDKRQRLTSGCLRVFETLLDLPDARLTSPEIIDLLQVPAVRARFDIGEDELDRIARWLEGSGIRWGLHGAHRARFDLDETYETNSWMFGLRRLLLAYASGDSEAFAGIQPYDEIGGGDADLVGRLAVLVEKLDLHWRALTEATGAQNWIDRLRNLVDDFLLPQDGEDELACYRIEQAIAGLESALADTGVADDLPHKVIRDCLIEALDADTVSHRFLAGTVNFSTLMPMRAIPFKRVYLLGMNEGDYPRTRKPADFDLMSEYYRPGDRSRREDDRYLFLEAVLSAREYLYVSWVGRSVRNNTELPPSVLVGQLRDHIAVGWKLDGAADDSDSDPGLHLLGHLTCEYPLQPFSRDYFRSDDRHFTYAREWRAAHDAVDVDWQALDSLPHWQPNEPVTTATLGRFLASPVAHFLAMRLQIQLGHDEVALPDEEPFNLDHLEKWRIRNELLDALLGCDEPSRWPDVLEHCGKRIRLSGSLPVGQSGETILEEQTAEAQRAGEHYSVLLEQWPEVSEPQPLEFKFEFNSCSPVMLEEWLPRMRRRSGDGRALILPSASNLFEKNGKPRWAKLVRAWPLHLAACAGGLALETILVAPHGVIRLGPVEASQARSQLNQLVEHWLEGLQRPLPVACESAFALLMARPEEPESDGWQLKALKAARAKYESGYSYTGEVDKDPALKRLYPGFDDLNAGVDGDDFIDWAARLYAPLVECWRGGQEESS